jgi:thiamine-phosphate pyrophosphorylase
MDENMKKYLITSREFYSDTPAVFRKILHEQFIKHLPDFALYRDKFNPHYATQAEHFIEVCAQFQDVKPFLHDDIELAKKFYTGVHLTSKNIQNIKKAKDAGLEVIVSTHTYDEVFKAQELGADFVTYSPIFSSPNKGEPKGVDDLKELVDKTDIKIFGLGV